MKVFILCGGHGTRLDNLGKIIEKEHYVDEHIKDIIKLSSVDIEAIKKADINVVIDAVNSTGGIVIPKLLKALNCNKISKIFFI